MTAYYNEIDPKAAAWLRELIKAGHIAPGEVDERSIVDIRPSELFGFVQCHFFAGIGVWSHALRRAGWPDHRPVWTGSCPCQPFSSAGKGGGFDDERHLWPAFFHLIGECRPAIVFGEQVASKHADAWIDLVQADMEGVGYAFGAVPFPSAGVGAPHIRDRTYWLANAEGSRGRAVPRSMGDSPAQGLRDEEGENKRRSGEHERFVECVGSVGGVANALRDGANYRPGEGLGEETAPHGGDWHISGQRLRPGFESELGWMAESDGGQRNRKPDGEGCDGDGTPTGWIESNRQPECSRTIGGLADTDGRDASAERQQRGGQQRLQPQDGGVVLDRRPGPTNGLWRDADWLFCRDGKWRPVEPGTFPLAHGAPARVGRLRGYGNAINAEAAVAFIEAATTHEILDLEAA